MITKLIKEMRRKNEHNGKFNKNIRKYKEQTKLKNTKKLFFKKNPIRGNQPQLRLYRGMDQ